MPVSFREMCATAPVQSLSINGTPLSTLGTVEQVWENVLGAPELVGEPVHVPLRPGRFNVRQVPDAREFTVGILLHGAHDEDQAGHNDMWRRLVRLVWSPGAPLTVHRTVRFGSGDETHVCSAKYIDGLQPTDYVKGGMSKVALRLLNLDGYWYGTAETSVTAAAGETVVIDVPGDAPTLRTFITFDGGATGLHTLTNATTGCAVAYAGETSTGIELDVMSFTATAADGKSMVGRVAHGGDVFWMRMAPGENQLTFSGSGSVQLRTTPAYL